MKAVVTGGMGFIGGHVASELLTRGHKVLIYDVRRDATVDFPVEATCTFGDVRDFSNLVRAIADVDCVFHLAGVVGTSELFDNPSTAIDINIQGTLNVLQASKQGGVRRIFLPTKPNEWHNIYSVTAQAVEKLGHAYREHMDLDVRVLRVWNAYGPRQSLFPVRKVVPMFVARALQNLPLEVFGNGAQLVELLYVDDIATRIVDYVLFDGVVAETHEIRAPKAITVRDLATTIINMTDSKSKILQLPLRRGESAEGHFDRAPDVDQLLCKSTATPLDAGLDVTIDWYRQLPSQVLAQAWTFYGHD